MEIIFQYLDFKKNKTKYIIFKKKKKGIIYRNYKNWIFLYRFPKEIFFGKIIYFIYKIIFFFLNLTEIKKFKFCFLKIIFQNSDEKKCFKLVETKKLHVCLKHIYPFISRNYPFHWPSLPLINVPCWSVAGLDGHWPSHPLGVIVTGNCVCWLSSPRASLLPACLSSHMHGHMVWPCDYSCMCFTTPMPSKIV